MVTEVGGGSQRLGGGGHRGPYMLVKLLQFSNNCKKMCKVNKNDQRSGALF